MRPDPLKKASDPLEKASKALQAFVLKINFFFKPFLICMTDEKEKV